LLRLEQVSKSFDGVQAVAEVSLTVKPGRIFGFLGPNGAGKTTTLRMIMNILQPDSGRILFEGKTQRPEAQAFGYLPEERGLYQKISLREVLEYFPRLRGVSQPARRIKEYLERFELADRAQAKVEELSKGNQQKVQFINTILHNPRYLILDEPFSGLDPVNQLVMKEILAEEKAAGKVIIFSSHQMEQVEKICDDVGLINEGRLVVVGSLEKIKAEHGQKLIEVILPEDVTPPSFFNEIGAVAKNKRWLVPFESEADVAPIMARIVQSVPVVSMRRMEPTLEDIFIRLVKGGER